MNEKLEFIVGLVAFSGGFWILYGLYNSFRMQFFIVRRYEQETNLLDTLFFEEFAAFTTYLNGFLSAPIYAGHLSMCLWGWKLVKHKRAFKDIDDPTFVTHHFSAKEIRRVKRFAISGFILMFHIIAFFVLEHALPEIFA